MDLGSVRLVFLILLGRLATSSTRTSASHTAVALPLVRSSIPHQLIRVLQHKYKSLITSTTLHQYY